MRLDEFQISQNHILSLATMIHKPNKHNVIDFL